VCAHRCVAWHESKKGAETTLEDKLMQLMQRVRSGVANQPGKVWVGPVLDKIIYYDIYWLGWYFVC
jgi:hypothetical protein